MLIGADLDSAVGKYRGSASGVPVPAVEQPSGRDTHGSIATCGVRPSGAL